MKLIIKKIHLKTNPRGLNVIVSFLTETSEQRQKALAQGRYLFNEGELKEFYKDWKLLLYEEKLNN